MKIRAHVVPAKHRNISYCQSEVGAGAKQNEGERSRRAKYARQLRIIQSAALQRPRCDFSLVQFLPSKHSGTKLSKQCLEAKTQHGIQIVGFRICCFPAFAFLTFLSYIHYAVEPQRRLLNGGGGGPLSLLPLLPLIRQLFNLFAMSAIGPHIHTHTHKISQGFLRRLHSFVRS